MPYSTTLAERLRNMLGRRKGVTEKAMFGGLSFLIDGKMFCGVLKDDLVVRVNPEDGPGLLKKPHVRPMNFTGKPMAGFLYVSAKGYDTEQELKEWAEFSLAFVSTLPQRKKKRSMYIPLS